MNITSPNRQISGSAPFGCSDPNLRLLASDFRYPQTVMRNCHKIFEGVSCAIRTLIDPRPPHLSHAASSPTWTAFAGSIEEAKRCGVSPEFMRDAYSLLRQLSGQPGDCALECVRGVHRDIASIEVFLHRWEAKSNSPGYAEVLRNAKLTLDELQAFKEVLDEMPPEALADAKRSARIGKAIKRWMR